MQTHVIPKPFISKKSIALAGWIGCAAFTLAASSWIRIPVPGSPVPATLQTLAVLVIAWTLPLSSALIAIALTVVGAGLGLPTLAGGSLALMGPTGGYILGFFLVPLFFYVFRRIASGRRLLLGLVLAHTLILGMGLLGLLRFLPLEAAVTAGVVPFLLTDILKVLGALVIIRLISSRESPQGA